MRLHLPQIARVIYVIIVISLSTLASAGIGVSSPWNGGTFPSPVHFVASASSGAPTTAMMIYVDNNAVYKVNGGSMDTYVQIANGWHYVVVQSWDSTGYVQKYAMNINISGTTSGATGSTGQTFGGNQIANIDQMSGWEHCDSCAGAGGWGPTTPYSMTQWLANPSIDGQSATFWIGGSTPYAQALWWKQLGAQDSATHFIYDLQFYYTNPGAVQALEFDVNQSVGGKKFIFGTQCNVRNGGVWDVWDTANARWIHTGIACPAPPAYTWNRLTWEFERTPDGHLKYVAVTLNGHKSYLNWAYWPQGSGVRELNVAFQIDKNYAGTAYQVWLDKVSLNWW